MERLNINEYYMNIAVQTSLRSTCIRRKVGAIIVKDNRILSTGYNGAPSGLPNCCDDCNRCYRSANNIPSGQCLDLCFAVHAEQNSILNALKTGEDLRGATLYVNTYPCSTCAKLSIQVGIRRIYYIDEYENEFTKNMLAEAGVEMIKMDGSIYRTPVGSSVITRDDLDTIDPIVQKIYKFKPGTDTFKINRDIIFRENGLFEKYDEMIYYTEYKMNEEILPLNKEVYKQIKFHEANRNSLEYNGDDKKQLVIGALVYDIYSECFALLSAKGDRFTGKLTLVQGHCQVIKTTGKPRLQTIIKRNLLKEVTEELTIEQKDIKSIKPLYMIQSNDNKVSSEHMGFISLVIIDTSELDYDVVTGEPEKHGVEWLNMYELSNLEYLNNLDTWARKVIMKLKEDGFTI